MEEYKTQLEQDMSQLIETLKTSPLEEKVKHSNRLTELSEEYKKLTGEYFVQD